MAGGKLGGTTQLHLTVAGQGDGNATLALEGNAAIANPPKPLAKLLGAQQSLSVHARLHGNEVTLDSFQLAGPVFAATASGRIAPGGVDLSTSIELNDISALSPEISGQIRETGHITGHAEDYALEAQLSGNVAAPDVRSAPFSIALNVQHLPRAPTGTLTGSGALENSPLTLDAALARDASGNAALRITSARWRCSTLWRICASSRARACPPARRISPSPPCRMSRPSCRSSWAARRGCPSPTPMARRSR